MLVKLSAFIMFSMSGCVVITAQNGTPAPIERKVQRIVTVAPFERSYLGVQTQEITKENFAKYGLSTVRGVAVEKVVADSPAAQAGLQKGDVIVQFEGEEVTSVLKLTRLIAEVAPDHAATITVSRSGGEREINVTMGKRDLPQFDNGNFRFGNWQMIPDMPRVPVTPRTPLTPDVPLLLPPTGDGNFLILRGGASRQIGIGVAPLTRQLGDYFGVADGEGILISNVRSNSPAAKAGLKAGDIIVEADGKAVKEMSDLIRALSDKKEGDVSLTIIRDRNRQTVRVTPEASKNGAVQFEELNKLYETVPNQLNFQFQTPQSPIAPTVPENLPKPAPRIN